MHIAVLNRPRAVENGPVEKWKDAGVEKRKDADVGLSHV